MVRFLARWTSPQVPPRGFARAHGPVRPVTLSHVLILADDRHAGPSPVGSLRRRVPRIYGLFCPWGLALRGRTRAHSSGRVDCGRDARSSRTRARWWRPGRRARRRRYLGRGRGGARRTARCSISTTRSYAPTKSAGAALRRPGGRSAWRGASARRLRDHGVLRQDVNEEPPRVRSSADEYGVVASPRSLQQSRGPLARDQRESRRRHEDLHRRDGHLRPGRDSRADARGARPRSRSSPRSVRCISSGWARSRSSKRPNARSPSARATVVLNIDDPRLAAWPASLRAEGKRVITAGSSNPDADIRVSRRVGSLVGRPSRARTSRRSRRSWACSRPTSPARSRPPSLWALTPSVVGANLAAGRVRSPTD